MTSTPLIDDVLWNIFEFVTDDETIQNLSYCSKDYLAKIQAYFRGRYLATSRKCSACSKVVKFDQVNSSCDYHAGPSKSWLSFYEDPYDGWKFSGYSSYTCCGKDAACIHSTSHIFDKAKCKNCGSLFSMANKKGKNICRYHPGTDTWVGAHSAAYSCCKNTNFHSPGCTVVDAHELASIPGVIERASQIFWSRSGRKCVVSTEVGTFVFQYNPSFNRWTHTHLLQSRPGTGVSDKAYGLLEHPLQEPFSHDGRYLVVEKSTGGFRSSDRFVFDLANNKYIGPFCSRGSVLGYTWTSDNKYVVMLMKFQEDHGPMALHTFDVQNGKELPVRTFTPSTSSFDRKDLGSAYFVPSAKEPSTVSCRHPDLKDFAARWIERDVYVFFEPYGDKFLMVSSWGEMSLYRFNVSANGTVVKHLKYKSSFIPKGCSPPIRTVQWKKDGILIFAERNPKGRACEPQFYFDIYTVNYNLDETHVALDASICPSASGDVSLFRYDPDRNIYYYAQASVLRVLDAKTCTELWNMPLPKSLPDWHTELQFNVKNGILLHITNGIMLRVPETRPEQPVEEECFWTQFFNSTKCFVEK